MARKKLNAEYSSVDTERVSTETVEYDYSDEWPHSPRQPEASGPPAWKPYPGVSQPVLAPGDVTDLSNADDFADPFLAVDDDGLFHLFFEIIDYSSDPNGFYIGHATSPDAIDWTYDQVVFDAMDESWATQYPYIHKYGGEWYLWQSASTLNQVRVYRGDPFPASWTLENVALDLSDPDVNDPTVFKYGGKWWLSTFTVGSDERHLHYADDPISGNWTAHPNNPVDTGVTARNGGRPIVYDDYIDMPCRDGTTSGDELARVRMLRVTELTTTSYTSEEISTSPVLRPSAAPLSFNRFSMHHADPILSATTDRDIIIVDGNGDNRDGDIDKYSIGIYTSCSERPVNAKGLLSSDGTIGDGANRLVPTFDDWAYDYPNAFTKGNGAYECPTSGYYTCRFVGRVSADANVPYRINMSLYEVTGDRNLVQTANQITVDDVHTISIESTVYAREGWELAPQLWHTELGETRTLEANSTYTYFEVRRHTTG